MNKTFVVLITFSVLFLSAASTLCVFGFFWYDGVYLRCDPPLYRCVDSPLPNVEPLVIILLVWFVVFLPFWYVSFLEYHKAPKREGSTVETGKREIDLIPGACTTEEYRDDRRYHWGRN